MWWFPWENGSNPHKTPTTQPFSFIFAAMIFFSNKNYTSLNIFHIGAVCELVWAICGNKWPARHSKLSTRAKNTYGQSKDSFFILCKFWSLPVMAPMLNPHFNNTLFLGSVSPLWQNSQLRRKVTTLPIMRLSAKIWTPTQNTGVVQLTPNFVDHLAMFIKHGLHQKSHISGHLLRLPPLVFLCTVCVQCFYIKMLQIH